MTLVSEDYYETFKTQKILGDKNYGQICEEIKTGKLSKDVKVNLDPGDFDFLRDFPHIKFIWKTSPGFATIKVPILHVAIGLDDQEMVDYLLAQGVDLYAVSGSSKDLQPTLQFAVLSQKLTSIRKLLDAGVDVNDHGMKYSLPLSLAIDYDGPKFEISEYLISRGAQVNVEKCPSGETPMCVVIGDVDKMEFLVNHGADVNLLMSELTGEYSTTALILSWYGCCPEAAKFLLDLPSIDINIVDGKNRNCLHFADENDPNDLELILSCNIDVNNKNIYQKLPTFKYNTLIYNHHLVKLMVAGFYVCEENRQAVAGKEFDNFRAECAKELNLMKDTKDPYSRRSCFMILFMTQHLLALRYKNVEVPAEQEEKWIKKFPIYGKMLAFHVKKALQRKMLLQRVDHVLFDIFYRVLPAIFINELYHYFKIFELPKLLE